MLSVTFMGERTGTVQLVGISLALAGVVLASMTVRSPHASRPNLSKGIVLSITAMLGGGLFIFGIGNLSNELGWFLPIYIVRLCTFTVLLPTNLMMQGLSWRGLLPSSHVLTAILVGVLQFTGLAAYAMGAQIGPVSVAAASFSVYPVIPVVGGLILFKERLAPKQTVDIASALARIHRRRASGQCPEVTRGCSCESGIMVLKQQSQPQNKEHPIDATTQPFRSHPNRV